MAMEKVAEAIKAKSAKKYKPSVSIGVNVDTISSDSPQVAGGRTDWRKEEHQRLTAEVAALEKELSGFNAKDAAEKVRKSLEIKLKLKKLRLEECNLKIDGGGVGLSDY